VFYLGGILQVDSGVTLLVKPSGSAVFLAFDNETSEQLDDSYLNNSGTVDNFGGIYLGCDGILCDGGEIYNHGTILNEKGSTILACCLTHLYNYDTIDNLNGSSFETDYYFANENGATINNNGTFTAINYFPGFYNYGTINNNAQGLFNNTGTFYNQNGSLISNTGKLSNGRTINNLGIIQDNCSGVFDNIGTVTGNPVINTCHPTTLSIKSLSPSSPVPWGVNMVVSGRLLDSNGTGLAGKTIGFDGSFPNQPSLTVSIGSASFNPTNVLIPAGERVIWTNDDTAEHWVVSGNHTTRSSNGRFESDILNPGQSFNFTFNQAGYYPYYDGMHPFIFGAVNVIYAATTTTNSTGGFNAVISAPSKIASGWIIQAHFKGDSGAPASDSSALSFDTRKHNTALALGSIGNAIPWGRATSFPARLTDLDTNSVISGRLIHFTGTGVISVSDTATSTTGIARGVGIAASSVSNGWTVQAQFVGDSLYNSANSQTRTYRTVAHATALTLTVQPNSVAHATGHYNVRGVLRDTVTNTVLSSKTISFTATLPIALPNAVTSSTGAYSVSNILAPTSVGTYSITARYAGDALYAPSSSPARSLHVT
jgi:plastocyanin